MKIAEIDSLRWRDQSPGYLIGHPALSPVLADPTFCFPGSSPDGLWHLFAHSVWGIQHYTSQDGIGWQGHGVSIWNAMRPYLYFENGTYYLFYEKYPPLSLALSWIKGRKWYSEIAVQQSRDLKNWSGEQVLVSPSLPWHAARGHRSVSNPCLVKTADKYYLYYSASLVYLPDCGFNEPDSIGLAEAPSILEPYTLQDHPVITVDKSNPWRNLSCGSIKVLTCDDGFVGFENGIYWDETTNHSGSAIITLKSADGIIWKKLSDEPILKPSESWRRSHIYACDVRYHAGQNKWYMYYNARNDWPVNKGRENIGLLISE